MINNGDDKNMINSFFINQCTYSVESANKWLKQVNLGNNYRFLVTDTGACVLYNSKMNKCVNNMSIELGVLIEQIRVHCLGLYSYKLGLIDNMQWYSNLISSNCYTNIQSIKEFNDWLRSVQLSKLYSVTRRKKKDNNEYVLVITYSNGCKHEVAAATTLNELVFCIMRDVENWLSA